jgi:glycosyltransferase involved in cell wall biosynthesis
MNPLVSICVPTYRQPAFVSRLLNSVLAQQYKHIEVILSDDSLNDSIAKVAEAYADKLPIRYYPHDPALKSPRNWNFALNEAHGEYVMLLHQDDWLHDEQAINKYLAAFVANPQTDFVFCRNTAITPDGKAIILQTFPWLVKTIQQDPYHLVRSDVIGPPSNVMLKKSISVRYDEELVWLVDVDYYVRLIEAGHQYSYLDQHLVSIGLHEDQMTNFCRDNTDIMLKENMFFAFKNRAKLFGNWRLYDYYWRLLRNHNVRSEEQLLAAGVPAERIVSQIKKMISEQKNWPLFLLRIGVFSKILMVANFVFSKHSRN